MHPKLMSKIKKPLSHSGAMQATCLHGLPPKVLQCIKVNVWTLPALDKVDDDDPINFLWS
jgi:hypothetical protein